MRSVLKQYLDGSALFLSILSYCSLFFIQTLFTFKFWHFSYFNDEKVIYECFAETKYISNEFNFFAIPMRYENFLILEHVLFLFFFNQFKLFFCKYFPLFSKSFIPFFSLWIIKTEGKKIYETKTLFTMHKQVFSFDSFIELWLCKYDIDHFSGFHLKYLSHPTRKVVNTIFIAISFIPFCFYHISIGHMLKNGHTKFWNLLLRLPPWSFYSY